MKSKYWVWATVLTGFLFTAAAAGAESTPEAGAQELEGLSVGVVLGYNTDMEVPLLGVDGRYTFYAAPKVPLSINPALNYFFTESVEFFGTTFRSTVLQIDINVLVNLELESPITPYAGVGPAVIYVRSHMESSQGTRSSEAETDLGFNLLAGAAVDFTGPLRAFGQFRVTFLDGNSLSLSVGLSYLF